MEPFTNYVTNGTKRFETRKNSSLELTSTPTPVWILHIIWTFWKWITKVYLKVTCGLKTINNLHRNPLGSRFPILKLRLPKLSFIGIPNTFSRSRSNPQNLEIIKSVNYPLLTPPTSVYHKQKHIVVILMKI